MADDTAPSAGALGELFGDFAQPAEAVPYHPVHGRVLNVADPEGASLAAVVWEDPGDTHALHQALRNRIEAGLLAALSQPARDRNDAHWSWLRLASFAVLPQEREPALHPFGLRPTDPRKPGWRRVLAHLRHERTSVSRAIPDEPAHSFEVPVKLPPGEAGDRLVAWDRSLAANAGEELWGERPGAPFHRLAALMDEAGLGRPAPDRHGLDMLERHIVQRTEGVVRWIPPMVFQAVCDAVAVVAQLDLGREVQWGYCEPGEDGLAPPPLLRMRHDDAHVHVPVGIALLRWCIMPLAHGETPDPLSAWVADQFGA